MTVARVQVTMERDTNVPVDRVVNTLHYSLYDGGVPVGDFLLDVDAQMLADGVLAAWTPWMASLFGSALSGAVSVAVYDMSAPEPRVPQGFAEDLSNTVGATCLPAELAVCLSFAGAAQSGVNQARRRGRIFLGPCPTTAMDSATVGDVGVAATYRTNALGLGDDLTRIAATGTSGFRLGVLSRRGMDLGQTPDEAFTEAETLWVDNAFDVQRKRGKASTVRSTFVVP